MWYLFTEIWLWLLASFVLGWVAHWLLCCQHGKDISHNTSHRASESQASSDTQAPTLSASSNDT